MLFILQAIDVYGELLVHKTFYYQRKLDTSVNSITRSSDWTSVGHSYQHHSQRDSIFELLETTQSALKRYLISVADEEVTAEGFLSGLQMVDPQMSNALKELISGDLKILAKSDPLIVTSLFDLRLCRLKPFSKDALKAFIVFRNEHVIELYDGDIRYDTYRAFRKDYPACLQAFPKSYSDPKELAKLTFMNMNSQDSLHTFQQLLDGLEPPVLARSILSEESNDWSIAPEIKKLLKAILEAKERGWQSKLIGKSIFFGIGNIPLLSYKQSNTEKEKKRALVDQVVYELAIKSGLDGFIVPYLYVTEKSSKMGGSLSVYKSIFSLDAETGGVDSLPTKYTIFGNILYSRTDTGNTYCSMALLLGLTTKYIPRHSADEAFLVNEVYNEFIGASELDEIAVFSILFRANGYHSRNFVLTFCQKKRRLVIKNIDYEFSLGSFHHTISLETYGYRIDDNLLPIHPHFELPIAYHWKLESKKSMYTNVLRKLLKNVPQKRRDAISAISEKLLNIDLKACKEIIQKIYSNLHETAKLHVDSLEYIRMQMVELIAYYHSNSILSVSEIILRTLRESKVLVLGPEEVN